jgi:hypothetical protein
MHLGGSPEYQFVVAFSKQMMRDFAWVVLSPPAEAIAAS